MPGWRYLVGLSVGGVLAWLAVRGVDLDQIGGVLGSFSWPFLFLALLMMLVHSLLMTWRLKPMLAEESPSLWRLFFIRNAGIVSNNVVPIRVASEAVQLALLSIKEKVDGGKALAALIMARFQDAVVTILVLAAGLLLVPEVREVGRYINIAIYVIIALMGLLVVLSAIPWLGIPLVRRIALLTSFRWAVVGLREKPWRFVVGIGATFLGGLAMGVSVWFLSMGLDMGLSLMEALMFILVTITIAGVLPSPPAGVGNFEFAGVTVLKLLGITPEEALGFTLIVHFTILALPAAVTALLLARGGLGLGSLLAQTRELQTRMTSKEP